MGTVFSSWGRSLMRGVWGCGVLLLGRLWVSPTFAQSTICTSPALTVSQTECEALVDLYTALGGPSWTNDNHWLVNPDVSKWYGVITTGSKDLYTVTQLILNNNSLAGALPASLSDLATLDRLILDGNAITTLPENIGSIVTLKTLSVSDNQLATIPETISTLANLDQLDLAGNQLSTLPADFGALDELDVLDLSDNSFATLSLALNGLEDLDVLVMANNQITSIPTEGMVLPILRQLDLSYNQISELPQQLYTLFPDLHTLDIAHNTLSIIPEDLAPWAGLVVLKLHDNELEGLIPQSFTTLGTLQYLLLQDNYLDRTVTHEAYLPPSLRDRFGRDGFFFNIGDQRDRTAPILTSSGQPDDVNGNELLVTISRDENSYAINGSGEGLEMLFGGSALCEGLTMERVMSESGTAQVAISAPTPGRYADCQMQLIDHAGNVSPAITIQTVTILQDGVAICDQPAITIPTAECQALVAFYDATNGDGWTSRAGWLEATDVRQWYGVETDLIDGQQHVVGLYMHVADGNITKSSNQREGNGLVGTLSEFLDDLPYLRDFFVANNELAGTIPDAFYALTNLEQVYMQDNYFTGTLSSSLGNLTNLRILDLHNNTFHGVLPISLGNLTALEGIDLSTNKFSGTIPDLFDTMSGLWYVSVANNQFSGPLPTSLAQVGGLRFLLASNNTFTGRIPLGYAQLTKLENLSIAQNLLDRDNGHFAYLPPELLYRYNQLQRKSIGEQGDTTSPLLSLVDAVPGPISGSLIIDLEIQENSYAVDVAGKGMEVVFSGDSLCTALSGGMVMTNSGVVTVSLEPSVAGIYEGCTIAIIDHGDNRSDEISLPTMIYGIDFASICLDSALTIPLEECLSLYTMYQDLGGASRINQTNRWQSPDVKSWFGIETTMIDDQEHVRSILLHRNDQTSLEDASLSSDEGNGLSGLLTIGPDNFPYLRDLRLDHNAIQGTMPSFWGIWNSLEVLTLADNQLTGSLFSSRTGLSSLMRLDLSANTLGGSIPASLRSVSTLTHLDLHSNRFNGSMPTSLRALHDLLYLDIANNQLAGTLPSLLPLGLEQIDCADNQFSGPLPTLWAESSTLTSIACANNDLTGLLPVDWSLLTALQKLNLSNNTLMGRIPSSWSSLVQLRTLHIANNALSGRFPVWVGAWSALQSLDLSKNRITGLLASGLTMLDVVETFYIHENLLDRTMSFVAKLPLELQGWYTGIDQKDISNQEDFTAPVMTTETIILSPVMGPVEVLFSWKENGFAVNASGDAMRLGLTGSEACASVYLDMTTIDQEEGTMTLTLVPVLEGIHSCSLYMVDHAGNYGYLGLQSFVYDGRCGNGEIDPGEECDEGRFCLDGSECTTDAMQCLTGCSTILIDNCNPSCQLSTCGDGFVDADGVDNLVGTFDDEQCDSGKYCNNGRSCTHDPSSCPGGSQECQLRFTKECSPLCKLASCGDGYVDLDGNNDILGDFDDESCDDGNIRAGDGCSSSCQEEYCGDGFVNIYGADTLLGTPDDEQCDLGVGNGLRAGLCDYQCKLNEQECQWCYQTCLGGTGTHSIFLLIDVSGSMEGKKMQKAKQGAREFVQLILSGSAVNTGFTTKVGLIKFNGIGTVVLEPTTSYTDIVDAIDTLEAGGSTNFGDPIWDAITYFSNQDRTFDQHIILLSDGLPTVGYGTLSPTDWATSSAQYAKNQGIDIYTIAVEQTAEGIRFMHNISSTPLINVAYDADSQQSSTQSNRGSSRAIDLDYGNYAQTRNNAQARWSIDLGSMYNIHEIRVRNRPGSTTDTENYYIHVSQTPFTTTNLENTLSNDQIESIYESSSAQRPSSYTMDLMGRYVRIQLAGQGRLALAEVEIMACRSDGDCDFIFSYEDYTSDIINTIYGHIFGSIHCGCGPYQVCGICGDGIVDTTYGEECDQGSVCEDGVNCTENPQTCPDTCKVRTTDICTKLCVLPYCSDGYVDLDGPDNILGNEDDEECDDGNTVHGDGCSDTCTNEFCGDGFVDTDGLNQRWGDSDDEHCDDGNTQDGDGCSALCKYEFCGDGIVDSDGPDNDALTIEDNEYCDEGHFCDDGRSCTHDPYLCIDECRPRMTDTCTESCTRGFCGDGYADADGPNNMLGDTDDEQCDAGSFCPNGVVCTNNESLCPGQCEPGFTPGCTLSCQFSYCGDGYVDLDGLDDDLETEDDNEACDDGNTLAGDGCDATCVLEVDPVYCPAEYGCLEGYALIDSPLPGYAYCQKAFTTDPIYDTEYCLYHTCGTDQCSSGTIHFDESLVPGWSCPDGYMLQGCNDTYTCVRFEVETIVCTRCGDGTKHTNEVCDGSDLTDPNADACNSQCVLNYCGDGELYAGGDVPEACDGGSYCADELTNCTDDPTICPGGAGECQPRYLFGCTEDCQLGCGDGLIDPDGVNNILGDADDEHCDDGNTMNSDACTNSCKRPVCGDMITTPYASWIDDTGTQVIYFESCDDGNVVDGDNCPAGCVSTGDIFDGRCSSSLRSADVYGMGDDALVGKTLCDFGTPGGLYYDAGQKQRTWTCQGEQGGSSTQCALLYWSCGDGVVDGWGTDDEGVLETCDDGNLVEGDGCDTRCHIEAPLAFTESSNGTMVCADTLYPQVESGEYLPLWRKGSRSNSVMIDTKDACVGGTQGVIEEGMMCAFAIYRGDATTESVMKVGSFVSPCLYDVSSLSGSALLLDAIQDVALQEVHLDHVLGGMMVDPATISSWVDHDDRQRFGQYLLRLEGITFDYCGSYRSTSVDGVIDDLSSSPRGESCNNLRDDDGNGFIDCADAVCQFTDLCQQSVGTVNGTTEICNDGRDNDGDGAQDCADSDCGGSTSCKGEHCFDSTDNDGDGLIDCADDRCSVFCATSSETIQQIVQYTYRGDTAQESICEGYIGISRGYFVQQSSIFSEQANTGVNDQFFTLAGDQLETAGTLFDRFSQGPTRYQGASKNYLFDQLIETYEMQAKESLSVAGVNQRTLGFKKVPNSHIYYFDGLGDLYVDNQTLSQLLYLGGVPAHEFFTTPFTILIPRATSTLHIVGDLAGRGMYVTAGKIAFDTENCDTPDEVQGLFIAKGGFVTEHLRNDDLEQSRWCQGGSLQVKGTLFGPSVSESLALSRRSTFHMRTMAQDMLDTSSAPLPQATTLFDVCYLPALLSAEIADREGVSSLVSTVTPPVGLCMISTMYESEVQANARLIIDMLIQETIRPKGLFASYFSSTPSETVRRLVDHLWEAYPGVSGMIPSSLTFLFRDQLYTISLPTRRRQELSDKGILLPEWMVSSSVIDLDDPVVYEQFTRLLAGWVKEVRKQLLSFEPYIVNDAKQLDYLRVGTLLASLYVQWGPEWVNQVIQYMASVGPSACVQTPYLTPSGDRVSTREDCLMAHYLDFQRMKEQKTTATTYIREVNQALVDGASVAVYPDPSSWVDLAPGARDILESLAISF